MNTFFAPRFRVGWLLILIAAINSLGWFVYRWTYENSRGAVQITVDYDDTKVLADAYQIPHAELLSQLQSRGVRSIGIYQQSLANFRDNARISITPRDEAMRLYPQLKWSSYQPGYRNLITAPADSQDLIKQIVTRLTPQAQADLPPRSVPLGDGTTGILISASRQLISDAQLGFDPEQVKAVKAAGLTVTARISNALNSNLDRVRQALNDIEAVGAKVVIFSEDEVVGYDSMIREVAMEMRKRHLLFGNIEFTKQRGWQDFAERSEGLMVRIHSVGGDEAAKAKTHLLVDRFARAVKERNVRVAYIRLIRQYKGEYDTTPAGSKQVKSPLQQNLDFVGDVARDVTWSPIPFLRKPLTLGGAQAFGDYPQAQLEQSFGGAARLVRYLALFLTGLGAVGAVLLMLNLFFDLSPRAQLFWLLLGVLIVAVISVKQGMGSKLIGLVAGSLMSIVALLWGGLPRLWDEAEEMTNTNFAGSPANGVRLGEAIGRGVQILFVTSAISFLGAMMVVSAFNHWKYIGHADEFLGEKMTLLLPVLMAAITFGGHVFPHRIIEHGSREARRKAFANLQRVLDQPFTARFALVGLLIAIAGYYFMARSGNDSGMEISTLEWNFRAAMERLFLTRPRTKEVFIGVPAVIFASYFLMRRQHLLALGAIVAISIGQADIINTFCHFWTPLFYSLLRTVDALILGAVIGAFALWVWTKIEPAVLGRLQGLQLAGDGVPAGSPQNGVADANRPSMFADSGLADPESNVNGQAAQRPARK